MREGDHAHPQHDNSSASGHGQAAVRCSDRDHPVHEDPRLPQQHHGTLGAPEGRPHLRVHDTAGEVADPRATGGLGDLRRLHPLVPPGAARHVEWVPLRTNRVPILTTPRNLLLFLSLSQWGRYKLTPYCLPNPLFVQLTCLITEPFLACFCFTLGWLRWQFYVGILFFDKPIGLGGGLIVRTDSRAKGSVWFGRPQKWAIWTEWERHDTTAITDCILGNTGQLYIFFSFEIIFEWELMLFNISFPLPLEQSNN